MTLGLILDTSTEKGIVLLADGDRLLVCEHLPNGLHNSSFVLPAVQKSLESLGKKMGDLSYVAAGLGPGSYTGIRVSAAVAQTASYALRIPLIGFSSLCAFVPVEAGPFAVLFDAKVSGVYCQKGNLKPDGEPEYLSAPEVVRLDHLKSYLEGISHIVTPNGAQLQRRVKEHWPDAELIWSEQNIDAAWLLKIVWQKYQLKDFTIDFHLPLQYLRKTQAELEKS